MPSRVAAVSSVNSHVQRAQVVHWQRLSAGRSFPEITEFTATVAELKQLNLWDVEGEAGNRVFRMRASGERVKETFGDDYTGRTMEEMVPGPLRAFAIDAANECTDSGCAIFAIVTTIDAHGHRVDCERLLLPFGREGKVEQLVASLQLVSFEGGVELGGIAHEFEVKPYVTFSGMIPAGHFDPSSIPLAPRANEPMVHAFTARPEPVLQSATAAHPDGAAPHDRSAEHRRSTRRTMIKTGKITARRYSALCTVLNISAEGAALEVFNAPGEVPDHFALVLEMESAARRCTVVWRKEKQIGVEFR